MDWLFSIYITVHVHVQLCLNTCLKHHGPRCSDQWSWGCTVLFTGVPDVLLTLDVSCTPNLLHPINKFIFMSEILNRIAVQRFSFPPIEVVALEKLCGELTCRCAWGHYLASICGHLEMHTAKMVVARIMWNVCKQIWLHYSIKDAYSTSTLHTTCTCNTGPNVYFAGYSIYI